MSYKVKTTKPFERNARKLFKKYYSLANDILGIIESTEGKYCYTILRHIEKKKNANRG